MITELYPVIAFLVKKKTALLMNKSYSAKLKKQRAVNNNKVLTRRGYGYILQPTKYVYIKSTTVYVPSSELGLSQPLSRQRVCPSPQNRGGGVHSPAGEGLGVPIPTAGEKA
jgi:hypothetical protein